MFWRWRVAVEQRRLVDAPHTVPEGHTVPCSWNRSRTPAASCSNADLVTIIKKKPVTLATLMHKGGKNSFHNTSQPFTQNGLVCFQFGRVPAIQAYIIWQVESVAAHAENLACHLYQRCR